MRSLARLPGTAASCEKGVKLPAATSSRSRPPSRVPIQSAFCCFAKLRTRMFLPARASRRTKRSVLRSHLASPAAVATQRLPPASSSMSHTKLPGSEAGSMGSRR